MGFLKSAGASAGLLIFGLNELFIKKHINLDIIYYIVAGISCLIFPIIKVLNTSAIVEEDSTGGF